MSATIDERVVSMRFDNRQFEQATKQSMGTLQRLKTALTGLDSTKALAGIDKAANSIQLKGISEGIEALTKRFSTMGIVGMRVIQNLTDGIMNGIGNAFNFIKDRIISGGLARATNIENAHFQLQALLKDEEKVQAVMDNANKSVDGTAYAYDEAAKAASQFAATGLEAGDQMLGALNAIVGVAAMTNSEYEGISQIFTTVAGNGRLMGDQLLQLSSRGLNAAATISEYMNKVQDGTYEAAEGVDELIHAITNGQQATEGMVRDAVSEGKVAFTLFADAMDKTFSEAAGNANKTFSGAFSNLKSAFARIGQGFFSPLIAQESEVIQMINALREKVNELKGALVFDASKGNVNALSNIFTTAVLAAAEYAKLKIQTADMSKPIEAFLAVVNAAGQAVLSLIELAKPLTAAFTSVVFNFTIEDIINAANAASDLFQKLRPGVEITNNLYDGFKGVFSVLRLGVELLGKLLLAILPINRECSDLGELLSYLFGDLGRFLQRLTDSVSSSKELDAVFKGVGDALTFMGKGLSKVIKGASGFTTLAKKSKTLQRIFSLLSGAIEGAFYKFQPFFGMLDDLLFTFANGLKKAVPNVALHMLDDLDDNLNGLLDILERIDFSDFVSGLEDLARAIGDNLKNIKGGKGFQTFMTNFEEFLSKIGSGGTGGLLGAAAQNLDAVQNAFDKFITWVQTKLAPMFSGLFSDTSIGGIAAGGIGAGMVVGMLKIAKSFEAVGKSVSGMFGNIPKILSGVSDSLSEYQKKLKAEQLKEIAKAIILLTGAIAILSFLDPVKVLAASAGITAVLAGIYLVGKVVNEAKKVEADAKKITLPKVLDNLVFGINNFLTNLNKSIKMKATTSGIKDIAKAIVYVVSAIAGIYYMYKNDRVALEGATQTILDIGIGLGALMAGVTILMNVFDKGGALFGKAGKSVLMMAMALGIIVNSLKKLFKMDIPSDYQRKMDLLYGIFIALGTITVALAAAGKLAGKKKGIDAKPILALTVMLYTTVSALRKLFKMDLPSDYKTKLGILGGIFAALGGVVIAVGYASKLAKGSLKATGTILSLCAFMVLTVGALGVLCLYPKEKMLEGAVALGGIILALGISMGKMGKSGKNQYKNVLSMALMVGVIVTALGVLSMISVPKLAKAAIALGAMLGVLAADFNYASKMSKKNVLNNLKVCVAIIAEIAVSLFVLSLRPWDSLLAASASMSMVMLAFANMMKTISSSSGIKKEKINEFLKATLAFVPIGAAIGLLAFQPWDRLLAAGASISGTLLAFSSVMSMISSKSGIKADKINQFLKATLAIIPIATAIGVLAFQPWQNLLAAATALSATLVAFTGCFMVISKASGMLSSLGKTIALFDLAAVGVVGIALGLTALATQNWASILAASTGVSLVLVAMVGVLSVCSLIGTVAPAAIAGIALFDAFIADLALVLVALGAIFQNENLRKFLDDGAEIMRKLGEGIGNFIGGFIEGGIVSILSGMPKIGEYLSGFAENAQGFFNLVGSLDSSTADNAKTLAGAVLVMTAADLLNQIKNFFTGGTSLPELGANLSEFITSMSPFLSALEGVDVATLNACQSLAKMILMLTAADLLTSITGWVTGGGGKALSDFGDELVKFGPAIKTFASQVNGINSKSVEGAAAAAEIMAAMKDKLPGTDGLMQKIFGEKNLSEFAAELLAFGPAIKTFAFVVKDIDAKAVEGASAAGEVMAKLKETLPEDDGWWQAVFGSKSLDTFGEELVTFGLGILSYYNSIKSIVPEQIVGITGALNGLISMADNAYDTDFTGLTGFGNSLATMAENGLTKFYEVFQGADDTVEREITGLMSRVSTLLSSSNGVDLSAPAAKTIRNFVKNINNSSSNAFTALNLKMIVAGANIAAGVAKGINQNTYRVTNAMTSLAAAGNKAFNTRLQIKSPSRVMMESGENVAKGAEKGVKKGTKSAVNAVWDMGDKMSNAAQNSLKGSGLGTKIGDAINNTVGGLLDYVSSKVKETTSQAKDAGKQTTENVAKGISDPKATAKVDKAVTNSVTKAVSNVGKKTKKAVEKSIVLPIQQIFERSFIKRPDLWNIDKAIASLSKTAVTATDKMFLTYYKSQKKMMDVLNDEVEFDSKRINNNLLSKFEQIAEAIESKTKLIAQQVQKQQDQQDKLQQEVDARKQEYDSAQQAYEDKVNEKKKEKSKKQLKAERDIAKARYEAAKADQKAMKDIQNQNLTEEDKYWKKLLDKKKKGADAVEYAETSLIEFEMEILQTSTDLVKSYFDELDSQTDSIMNSIDIFAEVVDEGAERILEARENLFGSMDLTSAIEEIEPIDPEVILGNLEDQVNTIARYYEDYTALKGKFAGTILEGYVSALGMSDIAEMESILKMSDEQIAELVQLYEDRVTNEMIVANETAQKVVDSVTKDQLQKSLDAQLENQKSFYADQTALLARTGESNLSEFIRSMGIDSQDQIRAMMTMTDEELQAYMKKYDELITESEKQAKVKLQGIQTEVEKSLQEIFGTKKKIDLFDFSRAYDGTMDSINTYLKKIKKGKAKEKLHAGFMELKTQVEGETRNALDLVKPTAKEEGGEVGLEVVKGVKKVMKKHNTVMEEQVDDYIEEASDAEQTGNASSAGQDLAISMVEGIETIDPDFYVAGVNSANGFIDGVISKFEEARAAGAQLGGAALAGTQNELDINSPSKEMARLAEFAGVGFVATLLGWVAEAAKAGEAVGDAAKNSVDDAMSGFSTVITDEFLKMNPTIIPQMDLTNIRRSMSDIDAMFNDAIAMNVQDTRLDIRGSRKALVDLAKVFKDDEPKQVVNNYEMNQNNYSPKALSPIDIYRQTRNQFSQLQGVLNNGTKRMANR